MSKKLLEMSKKLEFRKNLFALTLVLHPPVLVGLGFGLLSSNPVTHAVCVQLFILALGFFIGHIWLAVWAGTEWNRQCPASALDKALSACLALHPVVLAGLVLGSAVTAHPARDAFVAALIFEACLFAAHVYEVQSRSFPGQPTCKHAQIRLAGELTAESSSPQWLIPDLSNGENSRWGLQGGLQFGFYPGTLTPGPNETGGPRGLIRAWTPAMPDGSYLLATFIAVEPTAVGNPEKGFSELEVSQGAGDGRPGKLMTVVPNSVRLRTIAPGVQQLSLTLDVERFHNGCHILLDISQRSDQPDKVHFQVHAAPDSDPVDSCVLTATWGNLTRSRELWLTDGIVNSLQIPSYRDYKGYDFAPDQFFPLQRMNRLPDGTARAALTTNERHPETIHPVFGPNQGAWDWPALPITQFWEAPAPDPNLVVRVNGRFMYWNSKWPAGYPDGVEVTGGTAFENFELRAPFRDGQEFAFGVSTKKPEELGFVPQPN